MPKRLRCAQCGRFISRQQGENSLPIYCESVEGNEDSVLCELHAEEDYREDIANGLLPDSNGVFCCRD